MLISVIVPVYKVEEYIYRCVDSILAQSFKDFELILVMMALLIIVAKYVMSSLKKIRE